MLRIAAILLAFAGAAVALGAIQGAPAPHRESGLVPVQNRRRARANPPASEPADSAPPSPSQQAQNGMRLFHGQGDGVMALAFSPDGDTLASGGGDNIVILWNTADGSIRRKLQGHTTLVSAIAFSHDGKTLVTGDYNGFIDLWDLAAGEIRTPYAQAMPVMRLAFLPDDRHFISGWGTTTLIWDPVKQTTLALDADDTVNSVLLTPENQLITADQKANLIVWDTKTGARLHQFSRPVSNRTGSHDTGANWIMGMTLLQDGQVLLCDMTGFWLWNRSNDQFTWIGKNLYNLSAAFDHDQFYAGGSDGNTLWFRDIHPDGVSMLLGEPYHLHAIAVSPRGDLLAVGGGGEYIGNRGWRTAGPTDIRVYNIQNIVEGMAAQKVESAARLETDRQGNPSAVIDHSAIDPADGAPLPWKKIK